MHLLTGILVENRRFEPIPLLFDVPGGGWNFAEIFAVSKLETLGYHKALFE